MNADLASPKITTLLLRLAHTHDAGRANDARVGLGQGVPCRRVEVHLVMRIKRRPERIQVCRRVVVRVVRQSITLERARKRGQRRDRMLSVPDRSLVPRRVDAVRRVAVVEDPLPSRPAKRFRHPVCLLGRRDMSVAGTEIPLARKVQRECRERQAARVARPHTKPTGQTKTASAMTADTRAKVLPISGAAEIG